MTSATTHWVLTAVCEDRPGIVHAISGAVLASGGNITESHQYSSLDTDRFFMRLQIEANITRAEFEAELAPVIARYGMTWELDEVGRSGRVAPPCGQGCQPHVLDRRRLAEREHEWDGAAAEQTVREWASSDGSGDPETIDWSAYSRAFFYRDPEADAERDGETPLTLRDGSQEPNDGLALAQALTTAIQSTTAISITDEFGTYTALLEPGECQIVRVRPQEYVAIVQARQV